MNPAKLIGLPYRLGADPEKHNAADCLTLARAILRHQGIGTPEPTREWYRRLRRKDYSVFEEELEKWGHKVTEVRVGTVALCKSEGTSYLATYWEGGWIAFGGSEARWNRLDVLPVHACYCPMKSSCAKQ